MVALVLIGVGLGELGDGGGERVAGAEVGGDGDAVPGAGVGPGERPAAGPAVEGHPGGGHALDVG